MALSAHRSLPLGSPGAPHLATVLWPDYIRGPLGRLLRRRHSSADMLRALWACARSCQTYRQAELLCYNINMLRDLRKRSWFAWLGLFALAGQIALTLGHVHLGRESAMSAAQFGKVEAQVQAGGHAARATTARQDRDAPAAPDHLGRWCAYCWSTAQARTLILPGPVTLRQVRLHQIFPLPRLTSGLTVRARTSSFESRGPPLTSRA